MPFPSKVKIEGKGEGKNKIKSKGKNKIKGNVKGVGQECPTHTGNVKIKSSGRGARSTQSLREL